MPFFGSTWGENEETVRRNQYFMYGILVSYSVYIDTPFKMTIDDVLKGDDNIQGIFTGRGGDFIIVGKVLEVISNNDVKALIVPQLSEQEELTVQNIVKEKYGFNGEFHYYFVTKRD
jgi:hypothetical protein